MIVSHLVWSMVWVFTYNQIKCKKNKGLVWCIDQLAIKIVHDIIERSKDWTILLKFCIWYLYDQSTMNRPYIILLRRPIEQWIDFSIVIRK